MKMTIATLTLVTTLFGTAYACQEETDPAVREYIQSNLLMGHNDQQTPTCDPAVREYISSNLLIG